VPNALRIEADEYLFTIGAVISDVLILRGPLTFYRLHETNAFQVSSGDPELLRRKQSVLTALADSLRGKLSDQRVPKAVSQIVVESLRTEADLLRLTLENGLPWETLRTELRNYRIMHQGASLTHWLFKCLTLLPACALPSRVYYSLRGRVAENGFYLKAREKWLPFLQPTHVDRYRTTRL
jgi:hypothetical protein